MLGHRQEFDVREAHACDVFGKRLGQFAVAPRFGRGFFLPGTDVDFVNAHRRAQRIAFAAPLQPGLIVPLELARVPDDGGVFRRHLEEKSAGIGVQLDVPVRVANFKFVMRADADARNENFPDAGCAEQPQGMKPSVPLVEIADDADALRVWRPDGETRAGHPVNHAQLRAEFFVNAAFVALAEEEQIRFAQSWQKRKGIARAAGLALMIGDHQVVGINLAHRFGDGLKDIGFRNPLQFKRRLVFFVDRLNGDFGGIRKQGADDEAGAAAKRMHPEQRVGRLVGQLNEAAQLFARENHAGNDSNARRKQRHNFNWHGHGDWRARQGRLKNWFDSV